MSLGENIKNKRNELKLSQEYIAEQLGVSRQAVSKWETGQSEPTASNLIQLAALFEISISELVDPAKSDEKQEEIPKKQSKKGLYLITLVVIVLLCAATLILIRKRTQNSENGENVENLLALELSYFKEGEEYQLSGFPWGTSYDELKAKLPPSYELMEEPIDRKIDGQKVYMSLTHCQLKGKTVSLFFTFLYDKLVEVQVGFSSSENAVELFEPSVAELTDLFGPETEWSVNEVQKKLSYVWKTDKSELEIIKDSHWNNIRFFVRCTEEERNRIIAENNKESRELLLTEFKQGQEYQFSKVPWKSSVEEVEDLLNCTCTLENVEKPAGEDYFYYDFLDVAYIVDGHEAKASVEFQSDELVYIDFAFEFDDLEDPKGFFEEIVSVLHDQYGNETKMNQNETTGNISYQWRTDTTQLAIGYYGDSLEKIVIYLAFLEAFAT